MKRLVIIVGLAIGFIGFKDPGISEASQGGAQYKFGVVPQFEPRKLARIWIPILKEIEKETGIHLKMVGSPKIPEFEKSFIAGEFDFAYMNPYHAVLAQIEVGYTPLIRDGGRMLQGILVVRKNDPIQHVKQLDKEKVAYPAPNALGASLLMRRELDDLFGVKTIPNYVQTHSSVYFNVLVGNVRAGGGVMGTFSQQKDSVKNQLRVIYRTKEIPPHPVVGHPRVPQEAMDKVKLAFLKLGNSPEGKKLLGGIPIKQVVPASLEDYKPLTEWGLERYYQR